MFRSAPIVIVVMMLTAWPGQTARAQDKEAEIKLLLKERSDVLAEAVKNALAHFQAGTVDVTQLLQLQREALKAKLELCSNTKERITVGRDSRCSGENLPGR
jgi:DNA-binding NtrC family response regulator